ncbi:sialic acid-binding Ig-like lectin 6 isoform X2 [Vicugna pacos]|uniref:Sialic acid-binding Ig-like lectin 6 isoform X2 n=1 Tax=Vicugna pacos TaxID=30538 RepID=A0ABM5DUV1_VICPA
MPTECVGEKIWRPSAPPRQRYKGQRWACCGRRHSPEQNPRWTIQAPRKRGSGLKNYDSQKALGLSANDSQVPVRRRYGGKTLFPETVGLQLPAILAVASLAPPTAPRVLHASPVRVLCAPAQKQRDSRRQTVWGHEEEMCLLQLLLLPVLWGAPLVRVLSYQLELPETVTVQESLCVLVPCKFSYPWSLGTSYMFWFQKGADITHDPPVATNKPEQKLHERTRGRFFLLGDFWTKNCSLSIRDVSMEDSGTYFFHVETSFSKHSYLDKMFSLKVTGMVGAQGKTLGYGASEIEESRFSSSWGWDGDARTRPWGKLATCQGTPFFCFSSPALIHKPHIPIPETLESGCPRNLTCSVPWACEQGTPPIFSWTSAALTSLGPKTLLSSVLTLTPRPQDHSTTVTCQVMFPTTGVIVERTIQLNVTYAPQNVAISIFQGNRPALETLQNASSLPILEGQALQLLCVTDSNPPAQLSWFRGSPALNATPISSTAILELPGVGTAEEGGFTCQAQNPLGSQHLSLSLSVVCQSQPRASWVLGAVGGAGFMVLLSLSLCLIFRVKTRRETQPVQSMDDRRQVVGSGSREHQFGTDTPADSPAPAGAGPISQDECQLHYAFLRFHKLKPQGREGMDTEYSEIRTHK